MNRRQLLKGIAGLAAAALVRSRAAEADYCLWLPFINRGNGDKGMGLSGPSNLSGLPGRCGGRLWLPQNLLWSPGTIFEDFENVGDWTFSVGVAEQDVTHVVSGAASIQMNGSPGARVQMVKNIDATIPSWTLGRLYIYVQDVTKVAGVRIYLINGNSDYYTMAFNVGEQANWGQGLRTGWNLLQFAKTDFTANGSPSWTSPMTKIQINLTSAAGRAGVVSVDSLIFGVVGQPAIVFSFDDGRVSHYTTAYQCMQPYRMVATSYVVSDGINRWGMTSAQLAELDSQGWDIGNHTRDHTNLVTGGLTDEEITAEFADCKIALDGLGLTRASMHGSMPFNNWNDACTVDARAAGMLSIRDDTEVWHRYCGLPHYSWFLWPRYGNMLNDSTTLAEAKARVDNTIARQQPLVFLADGFQDAAGPTDWAISDFQNLVDYIVSLHLPTLTITELYRLTSGPIVVSHA